jgi:hypothetical protein
MGVEVLTPEEASKNPPEPIEPPREVQSELRVIIWNTRKVNKGTQKKRDIMLTAYLEGSKPQTTDTHWNSEDGTGAFNWRMKFPLISRCSKKTKTKTNKQTNKQNRQTLFFRPSQSLLRCSLHAVPCQKPRFKLQVWDHDIVSPNDAIAEANLNLRSLFKKFYKDNLKEHALKRQWVAMTHPKTPGVQGEVEVSIEVLTAELAATRAAGFGRDAPNANPELPPPKRPETSFNPFRLDKMAKMAWKRNRWKVYLCCAACLLLIIIIVVIWVII